MSWGVAARYLPLVLVGSVAHSLAAQQADSGSVGALAFTAGAQLRVRSETWSNFAFADENDDTFVLARLLVETDLRIGEHVRAHAVIRSALSTERDLPGGRRPLDADDLDLQEAFLDVGVPLSRGGRLTARAGRQALLFGKQRLVSPLDWANTQRTFDGVTALLRIDDLIVRGFWAQPVVVRKTELNRSDTRRDLFGVYASDSLPGASLGLDLYWLGVIRDSAAINGTSGRERRHTIGARAGGLVRSTGFAYELETAYQFGSLGSEDISAVMVATQLAYRLHAAASPRLRVGLDYASGDRESGGSVETFDQLFPLGHAFLGYADIVGRQNVLAFSGGVDLAPHRNLNLSLTGHRFRRARVGDGLYSAGGGLTRGPTGNSSRAVGGELDATATYRFGARASLLLGYSRFWTGAFLEETGPARNVDFLYLSATLSS